MKILIIGCGNIGFRHLEALVGTKISLEITICDTESILKNIEKKICLFGHCRFLFAKNIEELKDQYYDLIIVATSSSPRFNILQKIKNKGRNIILEKTLFTRFIDYFQCISDIDNLDHIFVNTWYHLLKELDIIKSQINHNTIKIEVVGTNWGFACNSIHYINLFENFSRCKFIDVKNAESFIEKVFSAKRKGYSEIYGKVKLLSSNRELELIIEDKEFNKDLLKRERLIIVHNKEKDYKFKYDGNSIFDFQNKNSIRTDYMSQVLVKEYRDILESNFCRLPKLKESIRQHLLMMYFIHNIKSVENNILYT